MPRGRQVHAKGRAGVSLGRGRRKHARERRALRSRLYPVQPRQPQLAGQSCARQSHVQDRALRRSRVSKQSRVRDHALGSSRVSDIAVLKTTPWVAAGCQT
eukprot:364822-Chlamydomonas_euryale.AAC.3